MNKNSGVEWKDVHQLQRRKGKEGVDSGDEMRTSALALIYFFFESLKQIWYNLNIFKSMCQAH